MPNPLPRLVQALTELRARADRTLLRRPLAAFQRLDSVHGTGFLALALAILLLPLIPPHGVLAGNEETYFMLGLKALDPGRFGELSAYFDASRHRALSDVLLGGAVWLFGVEGAQAVLRLLAIAAYAGSLALLLSRWRCSVLDVVLLLAVLYLFRQHILGREWLFRSSEGKVFAYPLIFMGFYWIMGRRFVPAGIALGLAPYMHILVGAFWAAAAVIYALLYHRRLRPAVTTALVAGAVMVPLAAIVIQDRLGLAASGPASDGLTADYIYTFLRNAHHVAPFASVDVFLRLWLWRIILLCLVTAAAVVVLRKSRDEDRPLALLVVGLLGYLFVALLLSFLDRHSGALGKAYLFRPSSLTLFLSLLATLLALRHRLPRASAALKPLAALLLAVPAFTAATVKAVQAPLDYYGERKPRYEAAAQRVDSLLPPGAPVLIDPEVAEKHLPLNRLLKRPTVVGEKFVPTNETDLYRWYELSLFQARTFETGCRGGEILEHDVALLLALDRQRIAQISNCGEAVELADGIWGVLVDPAFRPAASGS